MSHGQFNDWSPNDQPFKSAVLATAVFKCILQGAIIASTWHYFVLSEPARDGVKMKLFIVILMTLILLSTALAIAKLYLVVVSHVCWTTSWLNPTETTLNLVTCLLAQFFFVHRCWRIRKSSTVMVSLLVFTTAVVSAGHVGVIMNEWLAYARVLMNQQLLQGLVCLWGFSGAALELLITTILLRFIWESRTGIHGLDKVILRLLAASLESSLPCLIFLLVVNLTVLLKSVSSIFFAYSLSSLYGISVMIALNCRWKVNQQLQHYRQEAAALHFSTLENTNGMTESQLFSEEGIITRRQSEAAGHDSDYRRPSIISFVKEIIRTPPRARLEL